MWDAAKAACGGKFITLKKYAYTVQKLAENKLSKSRKVRQNKPKENQKGKRKIRADIKKQNTKTKTNKKTQENIIGKINEVKQNVL